MNFNTHKEIHQQPRLWRETYDVVLSRKDEIKAFVDKYAPDFAEKPFLVGTFFADPRFTKAIYKYSRIALSK